MLFPFLTRQKNLKQKKMLLETMIASMNISPDQKNLYFQALSVISDREAEELYKNLSRFIEKIELKELENIKKEDFGIVAGMRRKEADEKIEEMNNFSFLLNNL